MPPPPPRKTFISNLDCFVLSLRIKTTSGIRGRQVLIAIHDYRIELFITTTGKVISLNNAPLRAVA